MAYLTFCGAAGTVTGSCSYIESEHGDFLVDCGLFQGNRTVRKLNEEEFPFHPERAKFLVLTHAHIDHSGLLPKLVKAGFNGPIYATQPTVDLLEFMLPDSAYIQESHAERINRDRNRRGMPKIEPIYTIEDAKEVLTRLQAVPYEQWTEAAPEVFFQLWNAGHLLGSSSVEFKFVESSSPNTLRMLFSGDLGPEEKAFHPEPDAPDGYDYIICESTYGDRERDDYTLEERRAALEKELVEGLARGGNIIIPAFAVERSQELLHDIGVLLEQGKLPNAHVYLDSPLARKATEVFIKHASKMEDVELKAEQLFRHKRFHVVESVQESKDLNRIRKGAIIISASGMCNAGRIKHHLRNNIWRRESTVLFVGYQSPGTLGHIIANGAEQVRIHGRYCQVNATIRSIGNYSAHADQSELLEWITQRMPVVGGLFLNHGDDDSRKVLSELLVQAGLEAEKIFLPQFDERFELVAGTAQSKGRVAERLDKSDMIEDWNQEYAAFMLRLASRLETLPEGQERTHLIRQLAKVLQ